MLGLPPLIWRLARPLCLSFRIRRSPEQRTPFVWSLPRLGGMETGQRCGFLMVLPSKCICGFIANGGREGDLDATVVVWID